MEQYTPTEVAKILHFVPHFSFNFTYLVNPKFTFDNDGYLESLAIVALMPVVLLLLTMIGFLFYYCCIRMKDRVPNESINNSTCYCSICLMITFIMLALGCISVASYGSIQCHDGFSSASSATMEINQSFSTITVKTHDISDLLGELSKQAIELETTSLNSTRVARYVQLVKRIDYSVEKLPEQTEGANDRLEWTVEVLDLFETYRTISTFSLIGVLGLTCLLGMAGVCFHSKCLLVITTFLGLVLLVITYLFIGANLMAAVSMADLCMDPYGYLHSQAVGKLYMSNSTAQYYMKCSQKIDAADPYAALMTNLSNSVISAQVLNADLMKHRSADKKFLRNMETTTEQLSIIINQLSKDLQCKQVHTSLNVFIDSMCVSAVEGFFLLTVSLIFTCFALTAVLCASPKTWKRYTKRRPPSDSDLDLDDVFLPASNPSSQPVISRINNPLYVSHNDRGSGRMHSNISSTNLPVAASNTLSFFRSEENITLLEQQPPPYSPPHPNSRYIDN